MELKTKLPLKYLGGAVLCSIETSDDEIALPVFKVTMMMNGTACSRAMFVSDIKNAKGSKFIIQEHLDMIRDTIGSNTFFPSSIYNKMCEVVWEYIQYFREMNEL